MREIYVWFIQLIKAPISANRFTLLSLPIMGKQYILDKKNRLIFTSYIRGKSDFGTLLQIYTNETYNLSHYKRSTEIKTFHEKLLSSGNTPLILDLGANIGLASKYLVNEYPGSAVWAIEPDVDNCRLAKLNLKNFADVRLAAVGGKDGSCRVENPDAAPNSYIVKECLDGDLPMLSISTIMKSIYNSIDLAPFILKIDIEGAESQIFFDNAPWLSDWPILIIELHDWMLPHSALSRPVLSALSKHDRDNLFDFNMIISISNKVRSFCV